MALPAYDQCIKASHVFNLLDARGAISVTERQSYILRVRELAAGLRRGLAEDGRRRRGIVPRYARPSARTVQRRNPRPHAAAGGGGSQAPCDQRAGRAQFALRGRAELRHPSAPHAACRRLARRSSSLARGAQGSARRRAGSRDPGLFEERRPQPHRGRARRDRPEEGPVLCRSDREAGPRNQRRDRRDHSRDHPLFSMAEIDALGRGLGEAGRAALGAPVARHRVHARHST